MFPSKLCNQTFNWICCHIPFPALLACTLLYQAQSQLGLAKPALPSLSMLPGQLCLPTHYSIASYASLLPGQLIKSGIPIEAKFQVSLLSRAGEWVCGRGEIEIKAKLSPAKAGAWAELGNTGVHYGIL